MATTKLRKNKSKTSKKRKSLKIGGNDEITLFEIQAQKRKNIMDYFVYYFVFGNDFLLEYIKNKACTQFSEKDNENCFNPSESLKQKFKSIKDSKFTEKEMKKFLNFHNQSQFINILSLCLYYYINFEYSEYSKCDFYYYIIEVYIVGYYALDFISANPYENIFESPKYLSIFDLVELIPQEERQQEERVILYQYTLLDDNESNKQNLKMQLTNSYIKYCNKMDRMRMEPMKEETFNYFYIRALKQIKDIVENGRDVTPEQLEHQEREYIENNRIITTKNDRSKKYRKLLYGDIEFVPYSQWLDNNMSYGETINYKVKSAMKGLNNMVSLRRKNNVQQPNNVTRNGRGINSNYLPTNTFHGLDAASRLLAI